MKIPKIIKSSGRFPMYCKPIPDYGSTVGTFTREGIMKALKQSAESNRKMLERDIPTDVLLKWKEELKERFKNNKR